jgi:hypothetical protein
MKRTVTVIAANLLAVASTGCVTQRTVSSHRLLVPATPGNTLPDVQPVDTIGEIHPQVVITVPPGVTAPAPPPTCGC